MKSSALNFISKRAGTIAVIALVVMLSGCKEHKQLDQVAALAASGHETASALTDYYDLLESSNQRYEHVFKIRFNQTTIAPELQKQFDKTESDIQSRKAVASKLDALYVTLGKIATNKPGDVQTAASNLKSAVEKIDNHPLHIALPGFSGSPVQVADQDINDAIGGIIAGAQDVQKLKDARRGNTAISKIVVAELKLFHAEKPLYIILSRFYIEQSSAQLKTLIKAGLATPADDIESSVMPFKITATHSPTTVDAKNNSQFYANVEEAELNELAAKNADTMDDALQNLQRDHEKLRQTIGN